MMFVRQPLPMAFTIFLICFRVSIASVDAGMHDANADEERNVQCLLLKILTAGLQESRYAVFEHTINVYEQDCFDRAYQLIADSNRSNQDEQLKRLSDLYQTHIKNYPKQNRQAILDGQIPEPIARNAGVAVNALCHQMFGFTL